MVTKSPTTTLLNRFSHMFRKPEDEDMESVDLLRSELGMQQRRTAPPIPQVSTVVPTDDDLDLDLDFTGMQQPPEPKQAEPAKPTFTPFESALRDTALLYAQGGFAAAQAKLVSLLAEPDLDSDSSELLFSSLFDVHRCAGQQDRFEALALDYASRFGRSPAEWFALQDAPPASAQQPASAAPTTGSTQQSSWQCPATLDGQALEDWRAQHSANSPLCAINWSALRQIDQAAAPALAQQIAAWCAQAVELQWQGLAALLDALKIHMASGHPTPDPCWWLIQLDLLRMLEQPQAFEDLALDYCLVFEVSPPSWQETACTLLQSDGAQQTAHSASLPSLQSPDGEAAKPIAYVDWELLGNITGSAPPALQHLRSATLQASEVSVSCARMGRLDMHAASSLLSWVKECNARACAVQFVHLPRLVLVYFQMLGMEKIASISAGSY